MTISTKPLSSALGAQIHGLDPARLDEADRMRLREAFLEYGVLLAKGLSTMTPKQHIALSRVFGECAIHPIPTIRLKGNPEIIVLAAELADPLAADDPSGDELIAFATQDRFVYLHRWDVGDLVIWDNSRTMHLATGHKRRHARRMHRTTLAPGRVPSELAA